MYANVTVSEKKSISTGRKYPVEKLPSLKVSQQMSEQNGACHEKGKRKKMG